MSEWKAKLADITTAEAVVYLVVIALVFVLLDWALPWVDLRGDLFAFLDLFTDWLSRSVGVLRDATQGGGT